MTPGIGVEGHEGPAPWQGSVHLREMDCKRRLLPRHGVKKHSIKNRASRSHHQLHLRIKTIESEPAEASRTEKCQEKALELVPRAELSLQGTSLQAQQVQTLEKVEHCKARVERG